MAKLRNRKKTQKLCDKKKIENVKKTKNDSSDPVNCRNNGAKRAIVGKSDKNIVRSTSRDRTKKKFTKSEY